MNYSAIKLPSSSHPFSLDDTDFDDSPVNLDQLPGSELDSAMNMASDTDNETESSESEQLLEAKMPETCKQAEEASEGTDACEEEDDEDEEDAILLD